MHHTTRGSGDRPPTDMGPRPTAALTSQLRGPTRHSVSVRPAGRPLRPPRPHVTRSRGPMHPPRGLGGHFGRHSQPQPEHRRSSPHRTCGSPRPEPPVGRSRDRVPRQRPRLFHRWRRHGARPPSRGSFYSGARVRPSPVVVAVASSSLLGVATSGQPVESGDAQTQ